MADAQYGATWSQKVFEADKIAAKVKEELDVRGLELPETPRMPDMRLIVKAIEKDATFMNPGKHSDMQQEIPCSGNETAAMVMFQGDTLRDQQAAAEEVVNRYNLMENGITQEFIRDMDKLVEEGLLKEAYGPAPFESYFVEKKDENGKPYKDENGEPYLEKVQGQVERLTAVDWQPASGASISIEPQQGYAAAYGTRDIGSETVFKLDVPQYVRGSNSTPEFLQGDIYIAIEQDGSTKPIAPEIARSIYGKHIDEIPVVTMHPDDEELIQQIDLKNGDVIDFEPPEDYQPAMRQTGPKAEISAPH